MAKHNLLINLKKPVHIYKRNPASNIFAAFELLPHLKKDSPYCVDRSCPKMLGESLGHVAHFFFSICNHTCPLPHRLVSTETGKCSQKPLRGDVVGARLRAVVESNSWSLFSVGWCGAASCRLEAARWTGRPWKVGPEGSTGLSSSPAPFQGPPSPCLSHLLLTTIMVLVVKLVIRNAISPIVPSCPPFPARVTPT